MSLKLNPVGDKIIPDVPELGILNWLSEGDSSTGQAQIVPLSQSCLVDASECGIASSTQQS